MNQNEIDIAPAGKGNVVVESVKFSWNNKVISEWPKRFRAGVFGLAYDIRNKAMDYVPVVTGALKNSIRVLENGEEIWIIAGGTTSYTDMVHQNPNQRQYKPGRLASQIFRYVNYAAKVEEKSSRPHYMRDAQRDTMTTGWEKKYFGGITK